MALLVVVAADLAAQAAVLMAARKALQTARVAVAVQGVSYWGDAVVLAVWVEARGVLRVVVDAHRCYKHLENI